MAGSPHAESEAEVVGRHDHGDVLAGKRLRLSIVTPRGSTLAPRVVDEVTAPGLLGEFGVLPGHVPFLTALRSGVLSFREGGAREVYAVGPGYVEVAGDELKVLVSRAERSDEIDVEAARAEAAKVHDEMRGKSSLTPEFAELEARLAWARAQLDAAERASGGAPKGAH